MPPSKSISDFFKSSPGIQPEISSDLDEIEKRKRQALIKLEKKTLFRHEYDNIGSTWMSIVVEEELTKPYFKKLKEYLLKESVSGHKIFPPENLIYSWSHYCEFPAVRVVIIGQDPYHNDGQANGLAFSVPAGFSPIPPSLLNIYKELANDIPGFVIPRHGDLSKWAQQGVLLLNATLTVRAHKAASHAGIGWEPFTDSIIKALVTRSRNPLVFLLWGSHAQKKGAGIDEKRHYVLNAPHPSPLSASRGFFGCRHFSKCNEFLRSHNLSEIDWTL